MITGLDCDTAAKTQKNMRCAVCGGGLLAPHLGNGEFGVRCLKDETHEGVARPRLTRTLSDGREYNVVTQRPVDERQALAIPNTESGMVKRTREAEALGIWPQKMNDQQSAILARVALAYGLDPIMGEIMPYQGRPYITIAGRRRKDAAAGHQPSIRFRPLTADERQMYQEAEVIAEGDLCGMCILTTETGSEVEAFAKVTRKEREAKTDRGSLRSPVVAANPIELWQKRAERRAREMAYGPIGLPEGLAPQMRPLEEGDVVEGEARDVDQVTGEIREPRVSDTGDIFPPDEAPDAPASTLEPFKDVLDQAGTHGLDVDGFCQQVLPKGCATVQDFVKMGGTPEVAARKLAEWVKKQAQAGV